MAFYRGPKLVKEGLIFQVDPANPKSYLNTDTSCFDLTNNGYDGELINGASFSTNNKGTFTFDGIDGYIDINSALSSQLTNDFTYSIWARVNSNDNFNSHGLIGNLSHLQDSGVSITIDHNETNADSFVINAHTASNPVSLVIEIGNLSVLDWINYVLTKEGDVYNAYINLQFLTSWEKIIPSSSINEFFIGKSRRSEDNKFLYGEVSNVLVYDKVLSLEEIKQNYISFKSRFNI